MNYSEKRKLGLCGNCNEVSIHGQSLCADCKNKRKIRYEKLYNDGICRRCTNPRTRGYRCDKCWAKKEKRHMQTRNLKEKDGITNIKCRMCESPKVEVLQGNSFCYKCYFKKTSNNHFGTVKYWKELENLFNKQNGKCVYSGRKIKLGQDSSLDHIIPQEKGGETTIINLQWTIKKVNNLKRNNIEIDFLKTVKDLHEYKLRELAILVRDIYETKIANSI